MFCSLLCISFLFIEGGCLKKVYGPVQQLQNNEVNKLNIYPKKIVLGIVNFKNNSSHKKWDYLEKAIPEILSSELSSCGHVNIVERNQIEKLLNELKLNSAGFYGETKVREFGNLIGANVLILGSITNLGSKIVISARIVNVETGEVLSGVSKIGENINQLEKTVKEIGEEIKNIILQ